MNKQSGASLILMSITLVSIMGFMGLAIDVGYVLVVRNELQNAADAAALAGDRYLYPLNGTEPNWSIASSYASSAISLNKANNVSLSTGDIGTGYWNITGTPSGLQSAAVNSATDLPAVRVTISTDKNGGGINTFFASILGINTLNMSATGVAINGNSIGSGAYQPPKLVNYSGNTF